MNHDDRDFNHIRDRINGALTGPCGEREFAAKAADDVEELLDAIDALATEAQAEEDELNGHLEILREEIGVLRQEKVGLEAKVAQLEGLTKEPKLRLVGLEGLEASLVGLEAK